MLKSTTKQAQQQQQATTTTTTTKAGLNTSKKGAFTVFNDTSSDPFSPFEPFAPKPKPRVTYSKRAPLGALVNSASSSANQYSHSQPQPLSKNKPSAPIVLRRSVSDSGQKPAVAVTTSTKLATATTTSTSNKVFPSLSSNVRKLKLSKRPDLSPVGEELDATGLVVHGLLFHSDNQLGATNDGSKNAMEEDGINVIPDNQEKQTQECKDAAAAAVVVEDSDSDMEEQVDELQCPQMYPPSFIVQPDSASSEGDTNNNCKNTSNTESTDLMNSDAMIIDSPPPIPSDLPNKTMICKINSSNENTTSNSNSASQGDDEINASCSIDTAAITTAAGGGAVTSSSNPENCAVGDNVGDDTQKEPASDEGLVVEPKPVRASRKKRKTVSLERGGLQLMDLPGGMRDFDDDFGFGIDVRMESRMEETSEKNHPIIKRIKKEKRGMFPAELGTTVLVLNHPGSIKVWHHEHALAGRGDDDDADSFLLL